MYIKYVRASGLRQYLAKYSTTFSTALLIHTYTQIYISTDTLFGFVLLFSARWLRFENRLNEEN